MSDTPQDPLPTLGLIEAAERLLVDADDREETFDEETDAEYEDWADLRRALEAAKKMGQTRHVICEIRGGVLQEVYVSDQSIVYHTLDHDNLSEGDKHGIPDEVFVACGLDPEDFRQEEEESGTDAAANS